MVWGGKGRSGIGDKNIQGTWEDWDGLSPNGRQYKNAITQETRNLSGADYWHARKADYPSQEPETWVKGKANIAAFADPGPVKKKETPVEYAVFPQQRTYDNLEVLEARLEKQLENDQIDFEEYLSLKEGLERKKQRAWKNLCRAKGWEIEGEPSKEDKEKERIGKLYYKELQAHNKRIEKEFRKSYTHQAKVVNDSPSWHVLAMVGVLILLAIGFGG